VVRSSSSHSRSNSILAALHELDFERLSPHLEPVDLPLGAALYEAGSRVRQLYFPASGIVSLLQVMADGASAEIAVVGNESVVGIAMFMGGESTPSRAVVQSAARAYVMSAGVLKEEFARGGMLQYLLLRYTQALIMQMSQTAVCNRHHSVEQQLCRWLLMSIDRLVKGEDLVMTQELIANMLGVRREGVTLAASTLQEDGLIRYSRGRIEVINRSKLEKRVCECCAVVKKEYDRLSLLVPPK
jgi:CRP-like cAMP-binding protein